eukprot:CAMPEP_0119407270 /NCGR_PEP_ID=MMETSP1335-20130426/1232_1 /TAXON_ID=259385 /ORGANISM="Chrysoculter rhomboideus, Strain RCC1486" /LENGTH=185 /DNA_ID=CAMNT_0007431367 /DNA_START=152 /DNA_END=711 /DNA_ORIENTATION=+
MTTWHMKPHATMTDHQSENAEYQPLPLREITASMRLEHTRLEHDEARQACRQAIEAVGQVTGSTTEGPSSRTAPGDAPGMGGAASEPIGPSARLHDTRNYVSSDFLALSKGEKLIGVAWPRAPTKKHEDVALAHWALDVANDRARRVVEELDADLRHLTRLASAAEHLRHLAQLHGLIHVACRLR